MPPFVIEAVAHESSHADGALCMPPSNPTFTVDTHVFRELGELLVGRDSTALLELIKNSYDADATEIVVTAINLDNPNSGEIVIRDNGAGMDSPQFERGFLRIASRFKEEGTRRSTCFRRRYTGSKGIGRLAAHKLAKLMVVYSVCGDPSKTSNDSLLARIDWEKIEAKETLSELRDEITLETSRLSKPVKPGTTITLSQLRRAWSDKERLRFVHECRSFQVPDVLRKPIPTRMVSAQPLFQTPQLRDANSEDPGCNIQLEGDFSEGDSYWDALVDVTNWVLEIDAKSERGIVHYSIIPTKHTSKDYPEARMRRFNHPHPYPKEGPFFQARILARDEQIRKDTVLRWSRQMSGVRVYLEGFRVLPYGDPGDDWLKIDSDVARRSWKTDEIFEGLVESDEHAGDWQLSQLPNSSYTGAVFLTQDDAPSLRMLVNREGFVTDRAFDTLWEIVRRGIDLLTRTRFAAKAPSRTRRREERERVRLEHTTEGNAKIRSAQKAVQEAIAIPEKEIVEEVQDEAVAQSPTRPRAIRTIADATAEALESIRDARQLLVAAGNKEQVDLRLEVTRAALDRIATSAERIQDSAAMLRVLASLGTQVASFVHEIRGLLGMAIAVHQAVDRLRSDSSIRRDTKKRLNDIYQSLGDMRQQIERQAAYLIDITSPDARRRRSKQKLSDRFDAAAKLVMPAIDRRGIQLINEIPHSLKSPAMFPAELTVVFSNLLTNAIKAANGGGVIEAHGDRTKDGGCFVVLENTGASVDLSEAERWFEPFESTTTDVDSTLGQGMGLGLTITRDLLEQYGASIRFTEPQGRFATAIKIQFPA